jgi:hypothetical protein
VFIGAGGELEVTIPREEAGLWGGGLDACKGFGFEVRVGVRGRFGCGGTFAFAFAFGFGFFDFLGGPGFCGDAVVIGLSTQNTRPKISILPVGTRNV